MKVKEKKQIVKMADPFARHGGEIVSETIIKLIDGKIISDAYEQIVSWCDGKELYFAHEAMSFGLIGLSIKPNPGGSRSRMIIIIEYK